jgi:hypothetical protein
LKSGKAVGLDGIPNEFLKFGGDIMITSFTNLFITVSDLEQTSSDWQKGIIIPIHKSASIYDLNNYRGITLTSNVYKIYASRRSDSDSAIRATSSAYIRTFIILDERETPMFSFSSISERSFIKIENRVVERIHTCLTPKS